MKTEMRVLEKLKETMASGIGAFYENESEPEPQAIDGRSIEIDFPDADGMPRDTMMFIQPDGESLEPLSMGSDLATMDATVCIMCRGASNAVLIRRVFAWCNAFCMLMKSSPTLGGLIDSSVLTGIEYYPAVTASRSMTAIEIALQLQWTKEFR